MYRSWWGGQGGWGGGWCMASRELWPIYGLPYPYPNAPVPFSPLPQKYFSLQPFVQVYKVYIHNFKEIDVHC
jgi:hypothetical protein